MRRLPQLLAAAVASAALVACATAPPPLANSEPVSAADTLSARGAKTLDWLTCAGQPTEQDLAVLAESGTKCIINLRTAEEMAGVEYDEMAAAEALGLRYELLPIASADRMTDTLLDEARKVLRECRHSGVLMH